VPWKFDLATDIGGRAEQQDRVAVINDRLGDRHLVVVADGMGGHRNGAEAAQIVIDVARQEFRLAATMDPETFLRHVCMSAHAAIHRLGGLAEGSPGSTCVLMYCRGPEAYWVHVGDSRLYHFREGRRVLTTVDHSLRELMTMVNNQDSAHKQMAGVSRNKIYMRLGGRDAPEPDSGSAAVIGTDLFMLCTDGFWDLVDSIEVAALVGDRILPRGCAGRLASLARERGGKRSDNVTLVLAQRTQTRIPRWLGSLAARGHEAKDRSAAS
jgi:serine/threonine protein phosphatase PrpC